MDKILFIVNPIAGGGRAKDIKVDIIDYMENTNVEYKIQMTNGPKDATNQVKKWIADGYETVVAVGGDGTVNEVATGIIEAEAGTLGILPSGTGNDLARSLNIPFNIKSALDIILKDRKKEIDIGCVNNNLFFNIASIGFDSEVVKNTEKFKEKVKSRFAYLLGIFDTLVKFKGKNVKLEIDDYLIYKDVSLVAVGNGKYYGGGLQILPTATVEDGYLHVIVVNKVSRLKLMFLFPSIFFGLHTKFKKYVKVFRAKQVKVITKDKAYLNVDGEIYDIEKETLFTLNKKKLQVYC